MLYLENFNKAAKCVQNRGPVLGGVMPSRVEFQTPPLAVSQPKLVQTDAQARQQRHEVVDEKSDGACTLSQKMTILSH